MNVLEVRGTVGAWLDKDDRKLICIEFFSRTSEDCKRIVMEYNRLARTYPQAVFLRLDVDAQSEEVSRYKVTRVPTFIFFYCGEEKERYVGTDEYLLEAAIQQYSQINQVPFPHSAPVELSKHNAQRVETKRLESRDQASVSPRGDLRRQGSASHSQPQSYRLGTKRNLSAQSPSPAPAPSPAPKPQPVDPLSSVRSTLSEMGFSSEVINCALRLTDKRDVESLVEMATLVSNNVSKSAGTEWDMAEQMLRLSKSSIIDRQREKVQEKSDNEVRANEAAKVQKKREEEEQHRKKVIEQFNSDHNFSTESPTTIETTSVEKAVILVDSIFAQSQYNIGRNALRMIQKILKNTELPDPKYRMLRKDSNVLRTTVGAATGGIALLNIAGFELVGDNYVMKTRNDSLVNGIIQTIDKRIMPQSRLVK
ncbi:hypothetical protein WA588_004098 [Blastocystis sp. NMH]